MALSSGERLDQITVSIASCRYQQPYQHHWHGRE